MSSSEMTRANFFSYLEASTKSIILWRETKHIINILAMPHARLGAQYYTIGNFEQMATKTKCSIRIKKAPDNR